VNVKLPGNDAPVNTPTSFGNIQNLVVAISAACSRPRSAIHLGGWSRPAKQKRIRRSVDAWISIVTATEDERISLASLGVLRDSGSQEVYDATYFLSNSARVCKAA
jgi:hypothetical protein